MDEPDIPKPEPSLWGEEAERPKCPGCGMRMITVVAEALRSIECLRCGYAQMEDPTLRPASTPYADPQIGEVLMCQRCDEINDQLKRYARLRSRVADREIIDAADAIVVVLRAEMLELHPLPIFH